MDEIRAAFGLDEVGENKQVSRALQAYNEKAAGYAARLKELAQGSSDQAEAAKKQLRMTDRAASASRALADESRSATTSRRRSPPGSRPRRRRPTPPSPRPR